MKRFFAVFFLILAISTFAAADVYIKSKSHTDPISIMGQNQPASDTFSEQWIGDGKIAGITPNITMILDLGKNVLDFVNHNDKTYVETSLPLDLAKLMPPEMAAQMALMKTTVTVKPTGKKKTIATRLCDEYDVTRTMMTMTLKLKVYATLNVPFDIKNYLEKVQSNMQSMEMPGLDSASAKELRKIKGFWMATETAGETMGAKIHSTTEVIQMIKKPAPAGIYSVPKGYTKQDKLNMQSLSGR